MFGTQDFRPSGISFADPLAASRQEAFYVFSHAKLRLTYFIVVSRFARSMQTKKTQTQTHKQSHTPSPQPYTSVKTRSPRSLARGVPPSCPTQHKLEDAPCCCCCTFTKSLPPPILFWAVAVCESRSREREGESMRRRSSKRNSGYVWCQTFNAR